MRVMLKRVELEGIKNIILQGRRTEDVFDRCGRDEDVGRRRTYLTSF